MKLPREKILSGCKDPAGMQPLIKQAETVLSTWQPIWSEFVSAPLRKEAISRMSGLADLQWNHDGGRPNAERQRLLCQRKNTQEEISILKIPFSGLEIQGNFLFDKANIIDIQNLLDQLNISNGEIGDIWMKGERGGQAICTPEAAQKLNGLESQIREVKVNLYAVDIKQLQFPFQRSPKKLTTVEASRRLDAIASAGFGLSRAKIVKKIKEGKVRLNWEPIVHTSKELGIGDCLQMEERGAIEILNIKMTKRERWRIELLRT